MAPGIELGAILRDTCWRFGVVAGSNEARYWSRPARCSSACLSCGLNGLRDVSGCVVFND